MPYILSTSLYPSHKAIEVAKKYLEALKKYPPDETLANEVVPAAVKTTRQGIEVISIAEVKEGQLEAALRTVGSTYAMFQSIVGFEYSIDVYATVAEAMTTIGMSLPE